MSDSILYILKYRVCLIVLNLEKRSFWALVALWKEKTITFWKDTNKQFSVWFLETKWIKLIDISLFKCLHYLCMRLVNWFCNWTNEISEILSSFDNGVRYNLRQLWFWGVKPNFLYAYIAASEDLSFGHPVSEKGKVNWWPL